MDPDSIEWPALPAATIAAIVLLIAVAAILSASESALLNVNRYRLRNLARLSNAGARRTERLLAQSDRLITTLLLCKVATTIAAAMTMGMICWPAGTFVVAIGAIVLGLLMLIVDIAARALGARYPERIAIPMAASCQALVSILHPLIWTVSRLSSALLRTFGVTSTATALISLNTRDSEPGPPSHQKMMARVLELQSVTVEDIMVPRSEISSIDISDDWDSTLDLLRTTPHTRLPLCDGNLDNVIGMVHMKKVAHALAHSELSRESLLRLAREREAYFVPEGTTLDVQLQNFQRDRRRIALVVDEYGDIRGLVTLEDILEEIVGEFTSDPGTLHKDIHRDSDGSYVINGAINVRVLNRTLGWKLPTEGPRTLNGLILEYLENIPEPGTALRMGNLSIEILQAIDNAVKTARIRVLADEDTPEHLPQAAQR